MDGSDLSATLSAVPLDLRWPIARVLPLVIASPHSGSDYPAEFVAASRLGSEQEDRLKAALQETLGYPFMITFTYFSDEIPRSAGGKLEQFISKVA